MRILNDWRILLLVSCTLGLAPFFPEPHIWGKLKWIAGGAVGMHRIDWLDALLHVLPWILLTRLLIVRAIQRLK
ncbi:MAG: hypothetical protein IM574_07625 [Cytophagales bacterium]|nr:hypothetical protein [Cytophagales bacterium]MCA6392896.1 hypothetical protein [Cytophagales bacterium]MCA6397782.1 hypothetical protein [Cytophagales bacterium]MCA6400974.1 hypothetical protein [Cytophagales bacterium]MCA6404872.1 hypothetical protein [Cytophagales bacterium]